MSLEVHVCSKVRSGIHLRPKKVNDMFLRHRPRHFQPPRIKNFYGIPTNKCEKSSSNHELSVQSGRHLPCLWLVGWLNSGAPALAIRHHLLKVGNFYGTSSEHRFYLKKVKKIKIKSRPPASFSEKRCLRNILLSFFGLIKFH